MEAHYGETPGDMINNHDIDAIARFVPRIEPDSSVGEYETLPSSHYSLLEDGCGWNCSLGDPCPICSADDCNSAITDGRSQDDLTPQETVPRPLVDTATDPNQAAVLEHPWPQNMPEDGQVHQPEANVHMNLVVLANRQLPGVRMVFDQQMNPRRITSRRPMNRREREERKSKYGLVCETCRRRKIRCDHVSKGGRMAAELIIFLGLGRWLSICVEHFVVNSDGRALASYRVLAKPRLRWPNGVVGDLLFQLRQMMPWLVSSLALKHRISERGGTRPHESESLRPLSEHFGNITSLVLSSYSDSMCKFLEWPQVLLTRYTTSTVPFSLRLASLDNPLTLQWWVDMEMQNARCPRCSRILSDKDAEALVYQCCRPCSGNHCKHRLQVGGLSNGPCFISHGRGSWWTTIRFQSPLPGPVGQ